MSTKLLPSQVEGIFPKDVKIRKIEIMERWIEYKGIKYYCRKIGSEAWSVKRIEEFPFYKLCKDFISYSNE